MATVVVLTDPETADGFRLAGVETMTASEPGDAQKQLNKLLEREDVGVIAINDELMDQIDERTREHIEKLYRPIVVAMPSVATQDSGEERSARLARLIRKAVGFEIKLGGEAATEQAAE